MYHLIKNLLHINNYYVLPCVVFARPFAGKKNDKEISKIINNILYDVVRQKIKITW